MSSWNPDKDVVITDSEEEDDILKREYTGREAMLFVVDANLQRTPQYLAEALKIIENAMISGILVNDKDLIGVVFANTEKSPPPYEPNCLENIVVPNNAAVFLPPRQLTKPIVDHYLDFIKSAPETFANIYGVAHNNGCGNFEHMLRLCINLFERCGVKLDLSKIVYMTDRTTPHPPDTRDYQMAMLKAKDLEGKDIEFHVIPMIDDFDYDIFYKEFLTLVRDIDIDSFVRPDAQQLREILEDRKLKQDFLKRCLGHFDFSLGPNLRVSVQYYNYFERRKYPRKVKINRRNNAIVKKKNVIMVRKVDGESNEIIEESQIKANEGWYEINLGQMSIRITPAQMNRIRSLHEPGMMLLGFKPKSTLPENMFYKSSNFMYPDDRKIIGSKRLFRALWQRCYEREKIAVCLFMCKRNSKPRYVALVPVAANDVKDTKNVRSLLSGDGFKIVYLPFAKHVRHPDLRDWNCIENSATEEGVGVFEKVIKKLTVTYQPELVHDPVLEELQANLLALAFDKRTEETDLMPNAKMQDQRIEKVIADYNDIFGNEIEPAKKRPASSNIGGKIPKLPKVEPDMLQNYSYVEEIIKQNRITACTVAQLRDILNEHFGIKLSKAITKPDLVERIYSEYHK